MTSYTNTFTASPVFSTPVSYRDFEIEDDTTLVWAATNEDPVNAAADLMRVRATTTSLELCLPPADEVSNGTSVVVINNGSYSYTVCDNDGSNIARVDPGEVKWYYLTDNSTVGGTWASFSYGSATSAVDAAALDGNGLAAIGTLLNTSHPVTSYGSNQTLGTNNRAGVALWTGGAGTYSFSPAATLGNNWFCLIKNSGSGTVTLNPDGSETIDGVATVNIDIGESCFVVCDGTNLYTISKNSVVSIAFTRLVKSVAGSSNVTLTTAEAGYDIQEYTGALTGNISVIVPTAVSRWWVYNNTSGAFSLTVKTAAGTGIAVTQGTRTILHCDGTNVVSSIDTTAGTVTSVATGTGLTGGPITGSGTISLANTAVAAGSYGLANRTATLSIDAQGRITSASNTYIGDNTNIRFQTGYGFADDSGNEYLLFGKNASAVNYIQVSNTATGSPPTIGSLGDDTNVGLAFGTKGTGSYLFYTNSSVLQMQINHLAAADRYLSVTGGTGATPVSVGASAGSLYLKVASDIQTEIAQTSSTNFWPTLKGGVDGSTNASLTMGGTATTRNFEIGAIGASSVLYLKANSTTQIQMEAAANSVKFPSIGTTASAANAFLDSGASNNLLRSTSSARYKTDIEDISVEEARSAVLGIRPITYRSIVPNDDNSKRWYGLIAEEVEEIDKKLVHYTIDASGGSVPDGVQYDRIVVLLAKLVQDQEKQICFLEERIAKLESASEEK